MGVFHYAHGNEIAFHGPTGTYADRIRAITMDRMRPVQKSDEHGLPVIEVLGTNHTANHDDLDISDSNAYVQDNILRLFADPQTNEATHPVVYVENGSHEFYPTEAWGLLTNVGVAAFDSPPHHGDSAYKYLTNPPHNLGEVEAPILCGGLDSVEKIFVLRFNGFVGTDHGLGGSSPTPMPLHKQWTYPAGSVIAPFVQPILEP